MSADSGKRVATNPGATSRSADPFVNGGANQQDIDLQAKIVSTKVEILLPTCLGRHPWAGQAEPLGRI